MRTEPERNEAHLAKGGKIADRADTVLFDDGYYYVPLRKDVWIRLGDIGLEPAGPDGFFHLNGNLDEMRFANLSSAGVTLADANNTASDKEKKPD